MRFNFQYASCIIYDYQISCTPPKMHKLIPTSSSISQEPNICLIRNNMLGISKDSFLILIDPSKYTAKEGTVNVRMNTKTWSKALLGLGNFINSLGVLYAGVIECMFQCGMSHLS